MHFSNKIVLSYGYMCHFRNISLNAIAAPQVLLLISRGRIAQMRVNNLNYRSEC